MSFFFISAELLKRPKELQAHGSQLRKSGKGQGFYFYSPANQNYRTTYSAFSKVRLIMLILQSLKPEALSRGLPVFAAAQVAQVVEGEHDAVPGCGEPG